MRAGGATAVIIQVKSRVGEWASAEGVRNLDTNETVQLTDQTHIGDITMSMVAVSVMKLVEEGKVHLDDPIQEYLPDFESIIKPPRTHHHPQPAQPPVRDAPLLGRPASMGNAGDRA